MGNAGRGGVSQPLKVVFKLPRGPRAGLQWTSTADRSRASLQRARGSHVGFCHVFVRDVPEE
eukprot:3410628-Lingulodinium_polyedra.AAC.1